MKNRKSDIIKFLEDENQQLTQQLTEAYEHNGSLAERQQIRTTALHLALAHRLADTDTSITILANAAAYERFIGGYDAQPAPGPDIGGQAHDATYAVGTGGLGDRLGDTKPKPPVVPDEDEV